jgi:hypothetical protein
MDLQNLKTCSNFCSFVKRYIAGMMGRNEGSTSILLSEMPQNNKEKNMLGNMPSNYTKYLKQVLMYRRWVQIYLGV